MNTPCPCDENVGYNAHKHKCPCCGKCWKHDDDAIDAPDAQFDVAHTSPCCGETVTDKVMDQQQVEKALTFLRFGVSHNGR
jgi:hypothetical protein